jgi:hypothetical protein
MTVALVCFSIPASGGVDQQHWVTTWTTSNVASDRPETFSNQTIREVVLPYQGFGAWTATGEAKREAVNQWIRTSGAFDGVIDFDAALRDPSNRRRMALSMTAGSLASRSGGARGHGECGRSGAVSVKFDRRVWKRGFVPRGAKPSRHASF